MLYRHIRTGAVIEVDSEISGNWEPVAAPGKPEKPAESPDKPEAAAKTPAKSKKTRASEVKSK